MKGTERKRKKWVINKTELYFQIMLSFLLPFAKKIVADAVSKVPDDGELGEKLIDL